MRTAQALLTSVMFVCGGAFPALAGERLALPNKIVMTKEDIDSISQRGMLRGRKLIRKRLVSTERGLVWDDERVFTSRKADVLAWLRNLDQYHIYRLHLNPAREGDSVRAYQYALLCDELLDCADQEIARAVLYHYVPVGNGYLRLRWEGMWRDRSLPVADRVAAWCRAYRYRANAEAVASFWREVGSALKPEHLLQLQADAGRRGLFPHDVLHPKHVSWARVAPLLLPCVRREYLAVRCPDDTPFAPGPARSLVRHVLGVAFQFKPTETRELAGRVVDLIIERDGANVALVSELWPPLDPAAIDDASAAKLRRLALEARRPRTTGGPAFWKYLSTSVGKKEAAKDGGGAFLQEFLNTAFSKAEWEAAKRLRALVDTRQGGALLKRMLRDARVDITVTKKQFKLLQRAWRKAPEALDFLLVEDE